MNKQLLIALCMAGASLTPAWAQTKNGGISADMLRDIVKEQQQAPVNKALVNAVAANAIDDLTKNVGNAGALDTYFSIETPDQSITDQQSSGRCWMFSGFNVLRSNYTHQHGDSLQLELSQAYLFFYDQLEKANLMLQGVIDTGHKPIDDQRVQFFFHHPLSDGGTFCGVADLPTSKEIMGDFGLYFKNGDVDDLARKLDEATKLDWVKKSQEAIDIAKRFDIKNIIQQWQQLFE